MRTPLITLGLLGLASASRQIPLNPRPDGDSLTGANLPLKSPREVLLSLHRSLVEISSTTYNETAVGHFLADYLSSRGYNTELQYLSSDGFGAELQSPSPVSSDPADPKRRFNVLAWPGPSDPGTPRLIITSHIDVVPPHIPYSISDDPPTSSTVIRGRGSVDAKGAVAAQVLALQTLLDEGSVNPQDVMLAFVVGEENPGDGIRELSESLRHKVPPEAVIFGEPTENKLACGHKGALFCVIEARGAAGHSGYPWLGKSANEVLIKALAEVLATDLGSSERFGNTTVNVGKMGGGVAMNVIPEFAAAEIAIRIAIGPEDGANTIIRDRLREILDGVDPDAFSMKCTHGYGVVETECSVPGFETIVVNYGTDVPNLDGSHVRYLYGPGSILVAHGPDEGLTVGSLEEAVEGYKQLILHALRK
ncbi:related to Peptidase M20 domain-containing protein SMAC_03666.2 [Cephalotrichum gorgonifer]|uniref:Related to Peptidase M20 domain-containing protein SMAC_03666.2 n=1 Tax=Cephalotrichum gorgonifer TaxID=2041049 RepID=A0AAE8SQG4_9PEZI|nr:related to Peptidase M20 domain-containing protein SMAC_03666.2 [Cephalotrichum gorgonifer]